MVLPKALIPGITHQGGLKGELPHPPTQGQISIRLLGEEGSLLLKGHVVLPHRGRLVGSWSGGGVGMADLDPLGDTLTGPGRAWLAQFPKQRGGVVFARRSAVFLGGHEQEAGASEVMAPLGRSLCREVLDGGQSLR